MKRNFIIDILRGISAMFILLYHYTIRYNENPSIDTDINWPFSLPWGCAAVTTFFILTGYYMSPVLSATGGRDFVKGFLVKKVVRLYPSYMVSVMLASIISMMWFPGCRIEVGDIIPNLTMFPWLFSSPSVDGAYWFLRYEWFFYFIIAGLLLLSNIRWRRYVILGWGIISFALWNISLMVDNSLINAGCFLSIADHAQEFIYGMALYDILKNKVDITCILCLIIASLSQIINYDSYHIVFMFLTGGIIMISEKINIELNSKHILLKPFILLSQISYTVYLLHQIIGFTIIYNLNHVLNSAMMILLITTSIILILAWLVFKYIEKPIIGFYKKRY